MGGLTIVFQRPSRSMEFALEDLSRQSSTHSGIQVHRRERNVQTLAGGSTKTDGDKQRNHLDLPHRETPVMTLSVPAVDEGWGAWLFCFSAFTFEVCIWGWNNTYGIFQEYYSLNQPFDKSSAAAISTIGTASLGIQFIELVFVIILYQRYPEFARPGMYISLVICVAALLLSSFATRTWHMIALQGVVFGLSAGFLYSPVMVWLPEWFIDRRGLATGIIFCGSGVGGFIFPLMMGYLLEKVGFRWTLRIWALTFGICLAIALLGLKPRVPIRKPSVEHPRQPWLPRDLSLLKNPVLYVVIGITVVQALGFFPVSLFIPTYTSSLSSAVLPSRLVLALFNAASVLFLILFGRFSDSYSYAYVIMASGIGCALAAFVFWGFASSLAWIFAFATVFGGFGGAFPGIWPAAASEIGGNQNHITNIAFGCFTGVEGVMSITGPIIAASLRNNSDKSKATYGGFGFRKVELFVGFMGVGTMLGGVILLFYSTAKRKVKV